MNQDQYEAIRLALFTQSYAGYYFTNMIRKSDNPDKIVEKLANVLLFRKNLLEYFMSPKHSKREVQKIIIEFEHDKDYSKIKVYLKIEAELTSLLKDKYRQESYVIEEYENAVLSPAIERVVGNSLSRITDDAYFDAEFIKRKREYPYWYYTISGRSCLPTLRIIPFITRLIK